MMLRGTIGSTLDDAENLMVTKVLIMGGEPVLQPRVPRD